MGWPRMIEIMVKARRRRASNRVRIRRVVPPVEVEE
jgi:hypothetical protein